MIDNLLLRMLPNSSRKYTNLVGIKYFENIFQNRVFIKIENSV